MMPTFIAKKKGAPKRWKGQVWMDGKMAAVKWFGSAKADHRAAIAWEEQTKKDLRAAKKLNAEQQALIPTDSCRKKLSILEWANAYLEECERRNTLSTFKEKRDGFKRLMRYLAKTEGLSPDMPVESFGRRQARVYLAWQKDRRGPNCSNKDRKVRTTAWRWGVAYLDGFPLDQPDPFLGCQRYAEIRTPRYIPPETDFWKVYAVAPEREQALLTCYLNLAARKSELLRLTWDEVDFARNTVTLTTRKTRTGTVKRDEMPLNAEVRQTLLWLWENRQGASNHFHAIRHLAATILAQEGHSLFSIQHSLRHEKQSTTDRYLHGLGAFKEVATALDSLAGRAPAKVLPFSPPQADSQVIVRRRAR